MNSIEEYLFSQGFTPTRPVADTTRPRFFGELNISGALIKAELHFNQREFNYPELYLPEWPYNVELRKAFGTRNINHMGKLCHTDESQTWWDSSQAARLTAGVLEKVKSILSSNYQGAIDQDIIMRDFGGYWDSDAKLLISDIPTNRKAYLQVVESIKSLCWLVPEEEKPKWLSIESTEPSIKWLTVHLKSAPYPESQNWPPKDFKSFLSWIKKSGSGDERRISESICSALPRNGKAKSKFKLSRVGLIFMWSGSSGEEVIGGGLTFNVPNEALQSLIQGRGVAAIRMLSQLNPSVVRYGISRCDPSYIQKRNLPQGTETLKGRRIVLIGAGAIGGNVAKLLCTLSAGWGSKGSLEIIDPDTFGPENIGRHVLGMESLEREKSTALCDWLKQSFPYLKITPYNVNVFEKASILEKADIVINATGCQTTSIGIEHIFSTKKRRPPIIHSWIYGQGLATMCLLKQDDSGACYRCLFELQGDKYIYRFPLTKNSERENPVIVGCHKSYHPYLATAGLIAATQAFSVLSSWLNGNLTNKLQFNILSHKDCQSRPDSSPSHSKTCPFCNDK